jgi:hypothetical protein
MHIRHGIVPGSYRGPCGPGSDGGAPVNFRIQERCSETGGGRAQKACKVRKGKEKSFFGGVVIV